MHNNNGIYSNSIGILMHLPGAGIPMCCKRSALSVVSVVYADGTTTIFCLKTVKIYNTIRELKEKGESVQHLNISVVLNFMCKSY